MVGKACLPSNAYFPWIPIIFGQCLVWLNIPNFAFVYIDFMIFFSNTFWYVDLSLIANSLDPHETAHNEPSHEDSKLFAILF